MDFLKTSFYISFLQLFQWFSGYPIFRAPHAPPEFKWWNRMILALLNTRSNEPISPFDIRAFLRSGCEYHIQAPKSELITPFHLQILILTHGLSPDSTVTYLHSHWETLHLIEFQFHPSYTVNFAVVSQQLWLVSFLMIRFIVQDFFFLVNISFYAWKILFTVKNVHSDIQTITSCRLFFFNCHMLMVTKRTVENVYFRLISIWRSTRDETEKSGDKCFR